MADDDAKKAKRIARWSRTGVWLIRLLGWTWRFRITHDDAIRAARSSKTPFVFSLWHGQMLPLLYTHRDEGVAILISEHSDGEIIARIAIALGYNTVRGSSSRGAARALLGLSRVLEGGGELAITPDGPRGPAKSMAPGVAIVARRAGVPVVAAAVTASSAWRLKTWDKFLIPRPFAKIRVAYSDAVFVTTADAEAEGQLREAMDIAERRANG
jgi:lysophospholipid acyltransferase (LPLAT)-like uncharacterized protein